jgi:hypothetical protein
MVLSDGAMKYLSEAVTAGMTLELVCDRQREGMKSTRPCAGRQRIDMLTLLAALGPDTPLEALAWKMRCPKCGSHHFRLTWVEPADRRRRMRPLRAGELTLGEYGGEFVVACERCRRRGEYRTASLVEKFGGHVYMTELHERIAEAAGCRLARADLMMATERGRRRRCQAGFEIG